MTKIFQAVKSKVVTRTLAVSALAVVGAAGVGAAPVSANPWDGGYNSTAIASGRNFNNNANETNYNAVQANYRQNTTYVYYNNQVEANYKAINFNNKNFNTNYMDYSKFLQTGYNPW